MEGGAVAGAQAAVEGVVSVDVVVPGVVVEVVGSLFP